MTGSTLGEGNRHCVLAKRSSDIFQLRCGLDEHL